MTVVLIAQLANRVDEPYLFELFVDISLSIFQPFRFRAVVLLESLWATICE